MNKPKFVFESQKELIDELSKMPPMVIATAYLHALNYTLYGVDVTEKWLTATQQAYALDRAYHEGYSDALQRQEESEKAQPKQTDDSCLDFNFDKVKEILKKDSLENLIVDYTCEEKPLMRTIKKLAFLDRFYKRYCCGARNHPSDGIL